MYNTISIKHLYSLFLEKNTEYVDDSFGYEAFNKHLMNAYGTNNTKLLMTIKKEPLLINKGEFYYLDDKFLGKVVDLYTERFDSIKVQFLCEEHRSDKDSEFGKFNINRIRKATDLEVTKVMNRITKDTLWRSYKDGLKPFRECDDTHLVNIIYHVNTTNHSQAKEIERVCREILTDRGIDHELLGFAQIPHKNGGKWACWDYDTNQPKMLQK